MGFFQDIFCTVERREVRELLATKAQLETSYSLLKRDYANLITGDCSGKLAKAQDEATKLRLMVAQQNDIISALRQYGADPHTFLPSITQARLETYDTKYPEAKVSYNGRNLPNKVTQSNYLLRVQNWAQYGVGSPEMKELVSAANGDPLTIMKTKNVLFHKACDIAVSNIKSYIVRTAPYKYSIDSDTTGNIEYWKFAMETYLSAQQGIGSDCDDWATLFEVAWLTAGIPRRLTRCVAGITNDGQGHATNQCFPSDLQWHHLNSTSPITDFDPAIQPLIHDSKDSLGIASVWFSWDNVKAWSAGIPTAAAKPARLPKVMRNSVVEVF